jgi:phospholipid-binding lipoprotein MlaA
MSLLRVRWGSFFAGIMLLLLQGCSTVPNADARDPWESMNRSVYNFNDALDNAAIKPAAKAYEAVLPAPVRKGVHNVLGNLGDVWSMANSAMQLKGRATVETLMRISVNTVFGFAGVLDVASEMQLKKYNEDLGQTLGYWGVQPGPYLVLPIFGPSTLRDALAKPFDQKANGTAFINDTSTRNVLTAADVLDTRAGLLKTIDTIKAAALDPYNFVRDGYLQKRVNDIHDGNPPARFDYFEAEAP